MGTPGRIAFLTCDVQLAGGINHCMRKDKVMQLKARAKIPFAKETIGKGAGRHCVRQKHSNQANITTPADRVPDC